MRGKYWTYYEGKRIEVPTIEDCVEAILCRNKDAVDTIERLRNENKKLKEGLWKDEELQNMKQELKAMKADYYRGFPITESESQSIEKWQKKHEEDVHGLINEDMRLKSYAVLGGKYSYHFVPTSIGVSGTIKCYCGAEFEFQEIG